MAKLPAKMPKWAATIYRGDDGAWEEAKNQCRAALYEWAERREAHPYTDLSQRVTAIDWPEGTHTDQGNQIGYLLGQVAIEELDRVEERPIISALVIDKQANMPSRGSWDPCEQLDVGIAPTTTAREKFWLTELEACFDYYGRAARRSGYPRR